MATWKKIIVSGSVAELNSLTVDNQLTANAFAGDGSNITGVIHNSGEIASDISGSFGALSASIATRFDGLTSDYTELTNIPSGIISSSAQIDELFNIDGVHSGSAQVVASLVGEDIVANSFSGDGSQLTGLTIAQATTVSSTFTSQTSVALTHGFNSKNVTVQVYNSDDELILPATVKLTSNNVATVTFDNATSGRIVVMKGGHIVSGSANLLNGEEASYYLDYNNFTNVPEGIVSSSAQVSALIGDGIISGSAEGDAQGQIKLNGVNVDINGVGTNDSPQFTNLTLTGNLTVQGTTTSIETANLLVEDKFILLNSGSANPDVGGIIIDEGSGNGHAFIFNNSSQRFGFTGSLSHDATTATPSAFAAAVVDIDAGHADISEYQKNGNIKVDSGTIYIYS